MTSRRFFKLGESFVLAKCQFSDTLYPATYDNQIPSLPVSRLAFTTVIKPSLSALRSLHLSFTTDKCTVKEMLKLVINECHNIGELSFRDSGFIDRKVLQDLGEPQRVSKLHVSIPSADLIRYIGFFFRALNNLFLQGATMLMLSFLGNSMKVCRMLLWQEKPCL